MSMGDKVKHEAEEAKGRVKKTVGDVTNDPAMEDEGRDEVLAAKAKQGGDKVKDAAHDFGEKVEDAVDRMKDDR